MLIENRYKHYLCSKRTSYSCTFSRNVENCLRSCSIDNAIAHTAYGVMDASSVIVLTAGKRFLSHLDRFYAYLFDCNKSTYFQILTTITITTEID
jgi:hypothetical protein